jgi:hypothetical protein
MSCFEGIFVWVSVQIKIPFELQPGIVVLVAETRASP